MIFSALLFGRTAFCKLHEQHWFAAICGYVQLIAAMTRDGSH
jgi:hypothetical protein